MQPHSLPGWCYEIHFRIFDEVLILDNEQAFLLNGFGLFRYITGLIIAPALDTYFCSLSLDFDFGDMGGVGGGSYIDAGYNSLSYHYHFLFIPSIPSMVMSDLSCWY